MLSWFYLILIKKTPARNGRAFSVFLRAEQIIVHAGVVIAEFFRILENTFSVRRAEMSPSAEFVYAGISIAVIRTVRTSLRNAGRQSKVYKGNFRLLILFFHFRHHPFPYFLLRTDPGASTVLLALPFSSNTVKSKSYLPSRVSLAE